MITFHISDAPVTVPFLLYIQSKASAQFSILSFYRSHIGNCIYGYYVYISFFHLFQAFPIYSLIMLLMFFYLCITILPFVVNKKNTL